MRSSFSATALLLPTLATATYTCTDLSVPISFTAPHLPLKIPPFENHYQTVAFLNAITARNAASAPSPFGAEENITVQATISAKYCAPSGKAPATVQVLTHGLGFDKSYWDFGGPGSEYNYIEVATAAGYATLSYDRLGNGASTIADPYQVQQLGPETAVAIVLTTLLRTGKLGKKVPIPKKVVHVGHSFGSAVTNRLIAGAPELSDGAVLTGYSTVAAVAGVSGLQFATATNFHIAAENQARLSAYTSDGWVTWGDELGNQYGFLHYPNFDPEVLATAEANKYPFSIGEILTVGGGALTPAADFARPVLIIAGEYDQIYCASWCPGLLKQAAPSFPKAIPFKHYVQPDTGHGMNLHFNATGTYKVINDFFAAHLAA